MWNYIRLKSKGNAKKAIVEIIEDNGVAIDSIAFAVYNLSENHIECGSFEGGPQEARKYQLDSDVARAMTSDAANGNHAVIAYDLRGGDVYLLDTVPELQIASCVLLCVMNVIIGYDSFKPSKSCGCREAVNEVEDLSVTRDSRGRFVKRTQQSCNRVSNNDNCSISGVPMFNLDCLF